MLKTCDVQNVKWTLKASACSTCQQYQQKSCDCKWKWKKEKRRTQKSANKNDLCIYCHNVFNSKCSPSLILLFIFFSADFPWHTLKFVYSFFGFFRLLSFSYFSLSLSLAITEIVCRNLMKSSDWEPACLTKWYCSSWLIHLNIECSNGANRIKLNWLKYLSVHYTKRLEIVFHCIWLWNEKFST